ncbi:GGDEF domain-containing protein [Alteromonas sediminis]|uniref:diguanylate cyclase n=1 Tax=Alteromonas sediminis TaxID=2259342 RepID=A0A3N5Y2E0_9ALTE|nr:GGDEF domain-containing protein [Alteromonas sediminis]RPJ68027.1 GGDEF domain-containing protein [Alteromonas sediminis]
MRTIWLPVVSLFFGLSAFSAKATEEIDNFIQQVQTVTYDCPDSGYLPQLEEYLDSAELTAQQRFALIASKTQIMICQGQASQAQKMLYELTAQDGIDKRSYAYASAIYQIGFTYDFKEDPKRCEYYENAKALSADKHSDVYLSASLGIITNCVAGIEVAERLGMMFSILERYSASQDYGALAHIHNNIGLVYGTLDQHVLAAEQYLKAHEMGLKVYTGSNQLTILISAITSLFASGQFDKAYDAILEFEAINQNVATPLTNYYYYHALTGYYYRTGKINEMKQVLPDLELAAQKISSPVTDAMLKWYQVVPCVAEGDKSCISDYLADVKAKWPEKHRYFWTNIQYLALEVEMYLVLEDVDKAKAAFEAYANSISERRQRRQYSSSILSVANLYSKIHSLESQAIQAEQIKRNILISVIIVFIASITIVGFVLRKRQLARLAIDPDTGLLNAKTAIARIERLEAPDQGKSIALAIFDLGNFREINRLVGPTKGDFVLSQIANTLTKVTRDSDILGRFAPEQFILCLPNIDEGSAKRLFDRVQNELDNTFTLDAGTESVSVRSSMSIFITSDKLSDLKSVLDEMLLSISLKAK